MIRNLSTIVYKISFTTLRILPFFRLYVVFVLLLSPKKMFSLREEADTSNTKFAFTLYHKACQGYKNENIIISPLSIQTALAMLYFGANGETSEEIIDCLCIPRPTRKSLQTKFEKLIKFYEITPIIRVANKIYIQDGINLLQDFLTTLNSSFQTEAESINFVNKSEAAQKINAWTKDKTEGKIDNIIAAECIDDKTSIIIINAIHFKGIWQYKFDKELTTIEPFKINENETVPIEMMKVKGYFKYGAFSDLKSKLVELPFKDSNLSMIIILPNDINGLFALEKCLFETHFNDIYPKMSKENLTVSIPKFKAELSCDFNEVLKKMGAKKMFTDGADFSNMTENGPKLKVSKILQKSYLEIDEEGVEVDTTTGIFMTMRCAMPPSQVFQADRPFLYFIWDQIQQEITFMGKFTNP